MYKTQGDRRPRKGLIFPLINAESGQFEPFEHNKPPFVAAHFPARPQGQDPGTSLSKIETIPTEAREILIQRQMDWLLPASDHELLRHWAVHDAGPWTDNPGRPLLPMFRWHAQAELCLVHLDDLAPGPASAKKLHTCRWFSDVWSLPALLGSKRMEFYNSRWEHVPWVTPEMVSLVNKIPKRHLFNPSGVENIHVARIFNWATRLDAAFVEDMTHAVMSICVQNAASCKGRGGNAFPAMGHQMLLIQDRVDLSILAWESEGKELEHGILADSLQDFRTTGRFLEDPGLTLSVTDGELRGGMLGVTAYFHCDQHEIFMELFCDINSEPSRTRQGFGIWLKEINGYFMRAHPYKIESAPAGVTFTQKAIRLRIFATGVKPFTTTSPQKSDNLYDQIQQSNPPPTMPRAGTESILGTCVDSDAFSRRPKRSIAEVAAEDGRLDGSPSHFYDLSARDMKRSRGRQEWEDLLASKSPPQPSPLMRGVELPGSMSNRSPPEESTSEDMVEDDEKNVEMEEGLKEIVDDGDFGIFHGAHVQPDHTFDNHPFFEAREAVADRGWADFVSASAPILPGPRSATGSPTKAQSLLAPRPPAIQASKDGLKEPFSAGSVEKFLQAPTKPAVTSAAKPSFKTFGCPFHVFDPARFRFCLAEGGFRNVASMKHHLARCHRNPIRCRRCQTVFDSQEECERHQITVNCGKQTPVNDIGISEESLPKLYQRLPESTEEQRWFHVYNALLGDTAGSENRDVVSPYLQGRDGDRREDLILRVQLFWERNGPKIVSDVLGKQGLLNWKIEGEERGLKLLYDDVASQFYRTIVGERSKPI